MSSLFQLAHCLIWALLMLSLLQNTHLIDGYVIFISTCTFFNTSLHYKNTHLIDGSLAYVCYNFHIVWYKSSLQNTILIMGTFRILSLFLACYLIGVLQMDGRQWVWLWSKKLNCTSKTHLVYKWNICILNVCTKELIILSACQLITLMYGNCHIHFQTCSYY